MKGLFLIIYTAGHIGGFAGPVPYGMDECLARVAEADQQLAEVVATNISSETGKPLTAEERAGVMSLSFACEYRDAKPVLGGQ